VSRNTHKTKENSHLTESQAQICYTAFIGVRTQRYPQKVVLNYPDIFITV